MVGDTRQLEIRRFVEGFEGIKYEVRAMHPPSTKRTVVKNENTPFSLCNEVCILVPRPLIG